MADNNTDIHQYYLTDKEKKGERVFSKGEPFVWRFQISGKPVHDWKKIFHKNSVKAYKEKDLYKRYERERCPEVNKDWIEVPIYPEDGESKDKHREIIEKVVSLTNKEYKIFMKEKRKV